MLIAAAVGIKHDFGTVGRIVRAGIYRRPGGQLFGFVRGQIHFVNIGNAVFGITHQQIFAVGRERRRERHAGEVAQQFGALRAQVIQVHARLVVDVREVGDILHIGRESRRQHQIGPAGQELVAVAVLVHQRQPFDALARGAAFGNIGNDGVEIAFVAGQAFVNRIGHRMRHAPPVIL